MLSSWCIDHRNEKSTGKRKGNTDLNLDFEIVWLKEKKNIFKKQSEKIIYTMSFLQHDRKENQNTGITQSLCTKLNFQHKASCMMKHYCHSAIVVYWSFCTILYDYRNFTWEKRKFLQIKSWLCRLETVHFVQPSMEAASKYEHYDNE